MVCGMSFPARLKACLLGAASDPALEEILRKRLAGARERWPAIRLEDGPFLRHLARLTIDTMAAFEALEVEELFLACACARGDRAALAEVERGILAKVPRWFARMEGVSVDDLQQELRQKLFVGPPALILDYEGRAPLERWIRVAANRRALDQQRAHKSPDSEPLEQLFANPDPEVDFAKLHDRTALRDLLHEALGGLAAGERNLLRLHYLEHMTLEKLAVMEGVHVATVKRRLAAARSCVLEEVRRGLRERHGVSPRELDSMLRFVRSRLDLSLRRVLEVTPKPARG